MWEMVADHSPTSIARQTPWLLPEMIKEAEPRMAGTVLTGAQPELPAGLLNKVRHCCCTVLCLLGVFCHTLWLSDRTFNQNPHKNGENGCPSIPVTYVPRGWHLASHEIEMEGCDSKPWASCWLPCIWQTLQSPTYPMHLLSQSIVVSLWKKTTTA